MVAKSMLEHDFRSSFPTMRTGPRIPATLAGSFHVYAAIVTSTSTPASMLMIICLTTSVGAFRSINRLWILISNMSHVFEPSPQGVFRVVTLRVLVGRRTGPLTRRFFVFARSRSSVHTFSRAATLRLVRVIRILWIFYEITVSECPR